LCLHTTFPYVLFDWYPCLVVLHLAVLWPVYHDSPVQIAERSTRVVIRANRSQFIYNSGLITLFFKRCSSKSTLLYYNLLTFGAVCWHEDILNSTEEYISALKISFHHNYTNIYNEIRPQNQFDIIYKLLHLPVSNGNLVLQVLNLHITVLNPRLSLNKYGSSIYFF
jgi:hypothetical protein